jgi:hypothetical protein
MKDIDPTTIRGAWYYIYGKGSHTNLAWKLILGVPLFPFVVIFVGTLMICEKFLTRN